MNIVIKSDRNPLAVLGDLLPLESASGGDSTNPRPAPTGNYSITAKTGTNDDKEKTAKSPTAKEKGKPDSQPSPQKEPSSGAAGTAGKTDDPARGKTEVNGKVKSPKSKVGKLKACSNCDKMEPTPKAFKKCQRLV